MVLLVEHIVHKCFVAWPKYRMFSFIKRVLLRKLTTYYGKKILHPCVTNFSKNYWTQISVIMIFSLIKRFIIMYSWIEFQLMFYFCNFSHKFASREIIFIGSVFMLGFDMLNHFNLISLIELLWLIFYSWGSRLRGIKYFAQRWWVWRMV